MKWVDGGITAPQGFTAAGVAGGIKKHKRDVALLVSDPVATMAGVFTTSVVKAAPVLLAQKVLASGQAIKALVVNSGNANACTGLQGELDAEAMAHQVAQELSVEATQICVCSTGVIGQPLPMEKVSAGISKSASALASGGKADDDFAWAICTTDTFIKQCAVEVEIGENIVTIGGAAKGSGMVHPNMATILSFVTTDATIERELLQELLAESSAESYNMISVDGDTSTNDAVVVLANGQSHCPLLQKGSVEYETFKEAFRAVNIYLAKEIARDGEGATKLIQVDVQGAKSDKDARLLARSVVRSNLVKSAFFGADANWGRVMGAMGYAGANFDPSAVSLSYSSAAGEIELLRMGAPVIFDEKLAKKILSEKEIEVLITVGSGCGEARAWGCDLTYDYVKINGSYRS